MKTYDKEAGYQECLQHRPDMPRAWFDRRWAKLWFLAHMTGAAERTA